MTVTVPEHWVLLNDVVTSLPPGREGRLASRIEDLLIADIPPIESGDMAMEIAGLPARLCDENRPDLAKAVQQLIKRLVVTSDEA